MCNGAPKYNAWQLIKTGGQYVSTYIYSGDEVQLFSFIENAYCSGAYIRCNVYDASAADRFTIVFA